MATCWQGLWAYRFYLIVFFLPIILLPLPILIPTKASETDYTTRLSLDRQLQSPRLYLPRALVKFPSASVSPNPCSMLAFLNHSAAFVTAAYTLAYPDHNPDYSSQLTPPAILLIKIWLNRPPQSHS
ncbi:hypothetical protein J1605_008925 [Eschrichtius robustus]|uniref:Uncharacterized protein n=1 Tax=Eschrichtius robustus TaxID=9764 RepID=A0AB34GXJ3_ESCRO|nr:hypothetical protein J1605_008925 [Eschrichtius robustus]